MGEVESTSIVKKPGRDEHVGESIPSYTAFKLNNGLDKKEEGHHLEQWSPTPRPQTSTSPWPVRNRAAQQKVSSGLASEASHAIHPVTNTAPVPLQGKLSSIKLVPGDKKVGDLVLPHIKSGATLFILLKK